ncbi:MAG: alpha/beta hydrolase, partial [Pseudomonadota bacterium]
LPRTDPRDDARQSPDQPVYYYLHGNGGHLAGRIDRLQTLTAEGAGAVIMSYRSYSGSTGTPSEAANVADAQAILDWLQTERGIPLGDIVLFGESLGTGVAVQLAAAAASQPGTQMGLRGLILDSPFTSMTDAGSYHYPLLPVRLMLRDRYASIDHIAKVTTPILILHGDQDDVVPVEMSQTLAERATAPLTRHVLRGGTHVNHDHLGSMRMVADWVRTLRQRNPAPDAKTATEPVEAPSPQ